MSVSTVNEAVSGSGLTVKREGTHFCGFISKFFADLPQLMPNIRMAFRDVADVAPDGLSSHAKAPFQLLDLHVFPRTLV